MTAHFSPDSTAHFKSDKGAQLRRNLHLTSNEFIRDEFKEISGFDLDPNSKILKKASFYPDFHGDYCSAAKIELSYEFYEFLIENVRADSRFDNDKIIGSNQYYKITSKEMVEYSFTASRYDDIDEYYFIGFLSDNKTIIIHVCIT